LESLAQTLFREWFVNNTQDSLEELCISDVADINPETISKKYPFYEIEYLDTGSITKGIISEFQTYHLKNAPSRAQRIVKENDIVYSLVRPIQRHYGLLADVKENTIASTGFAVIRSKGINPHFIYLTLTTDEAVETLEMIAEGSTSAYPSLRPSDIGQYRFSKPSNEKLKHFSELSESVWQSLRANTNQIRTLTNLRDSLLPIMMSGEVRVKTTYLQSR
jgi:type I restriction enzyme S subunit